MAEENIDIDKGIEPSNDFSNMIPEDYKEKPYMKDIDSMDKLFEQFDNTQKLIGKRSIPGADSPQEEWDQFFNKLGRPEDPDKYEFDTVELPDELKRTDDQVGLMKKIFHEAGLTPQQANTILKKTDEATIEYYNNNKEAFENQLKQRDQEFEEKATKLFGERKETALATAETMLKKYVPQGFEAEVQGLDNKTMLVLSAVLNNIHQSGRTEDDLDKGGEAPMAKTADSMREDAKRLMMSEEWKDEFHPNHDSTKAKVRELYQKIAKAQS